MLVVWACMTALCGRCMFRSFGASGSCMNVAVFSIVCIAGPPVQNATKIMYVSRERKRLLWL